MIGIGGELQYDMNSWHWSNLSNYTVHTDQFD